MAYFRLIRRKLYAARALSLRDWSLFLQAWVILLVCDIALRQVSLPRIQLFVRYGFKRKKKNPSSEQTALLADWFEGDRRASGPQSLPSDDLFAAITHAPMVSGKKGY